MAHIHICLPYKALGRPGHIHIQGKARRNVPWNQNEALEHADLQHSVLSEAISASSPLRTLRNLLVQHRLSNWRLSRLVEFLHLLHQHHLPPHRDWLHILGARQRNMPSGSCLSRSLFNYCSNRCPSSDLVDHRLPGYRSQQLHHTREPGRHATPGILLTGRLLQEAACTCQAQENAGTSHGPQFSRRRSNLGRKEVKETRRRQNPYWRSREALFYRRGRRKGGRKERIRQVATTYVFIVVVQLIVQPGKWSAPIWSGCLTVRWIVLWFKVIMQWKSKAEPDAWIINV